MLSSKKTVTCLAPNRTLADSIVGRLQRGGFADADISVLFPDKHGTVGPIAGGRAFTIPGLGPFFAAGPLLVAMSDIAASAAVGGITGALVSLGIPENEAKRYEVKIKSGNILVSTNAGDAEAVKRVETIYKNANADDIHVTT